MSVQFVKRSAGKRERSAKILLYDAKRADSAPLTAVFQQVHEENPPFHRYCRVLTHLHNFIRIGTSATHARSARYGYTRTQYMY